MTAPVIQVQRLTKTYQMGETQVQALRGVELTVERGDLMAIMGPSGSGKSTLMNILGCLDVPTSGTYLLDGYDVSRLKDRELAMVRNLKIGFCFQSFNLLARTTALANVELPLIYAKVKGSRQRALAALDRVGLSDRAEHKPNELSGGQQQRVAIARAIVNQPSLILADEPTGALDTRTSEEIMGIFQSLNRQDGITVVFVTHERDVALHTPRIVHVRDGMIREDERVTRPTDAMEQLQAMGDRNAWELVAV